MRWRQGREPPKQGVFFEGQIFEAYSFVSKLVRKAKISIVLVDNYVDDSVLTMLSKRGKGVSAKIYCKRITKQLRFDLEKHNEQYPTVEIFVTLGIIGVGLFTLTALLKVFIRIETGAMGSK